MGTLAAISGAEHNAPAMLLVVDVGNTQTHFGAFDGERAARALALRDRAHTRPPTSSAPRCATCSSCAATASSDSTPRSSPRPCPQLEPEWTAMAERYLGHEMLAVGPGTKTGHGDPLRQPARDRRRPARQRGRAARALRRARACAWTSAPRRPSTSSPREGEYLGGSLMTGIEISLEALSERGARLPKIDLAPPAQRDRQEHDRRDPLGRRLRLRRARSTRSCAASTTSSASAPTSSPPAAWRGLVVPYSEEIEEVDDLLTLTGLRLLHERNS